MVQKFKDLVKRAYNLSNEFYEDNPKNLPNPYYIGFGNPEADILILGKEQAYNQEHYTQLFFESINNPTEWFEKVENKICFNTKVYKENEQNYVNCFRPYMWRPKQTGHTWNKYAKLLEKIYNTKFEGSSFLEKSFISEVNHIPRETSENREYEHQERIQEILKHPYYKSFKVIILACGNYLTNKKIEEIFEVEKQRNYSLPRQRCIVYEGENRLLLNTRQLSMDTSNEYLLRLVDLVKSVGCM